MVSPSLVRLSPIGWRRVQRLAGNIEGPAAHFRKLFPLPLDEHGCRFHHRFLDQLVLFGPAFFPRKTLVGVQDPESLFMLRADGTRLFLLVGRFFDAYQRAAAAAVAKWGRMA
jgi:hypothetical protein